MQRFLETVVYMREEPPPRIRDPSKPMQVICPGFPRCGTESLQTALIMLGYDYTYHGWDMAFEVPNYASSWARLSKKKFEGPGDGESTITAEEFDYILGDSVAVTDAAGSVFAAELIAAYPDAKVILNGRKDLEAWHRSAIKNLVRIYESYLMNVICRLTGFGFWSWSVYEIYMWPKLFRDPNLSRGIRQNGKWIYREHYNMIRGLVPKDKLLEWSVEDGWEPLCKFLGKEVPDKPFPRVNDTSGFAEREKDFHRKNANALMANAGIFFSFVAVGAAAVSYRRSGWALTFASTLRDYIRK